jgi:hypothetical protein
MVAQKVHLNAGSHSDDHVSKSSTPCAKRYRESLSYPMGLGKWREQFKGH